MLNIDKQPKLHLKSKYQYKIKIKNQQTKTKKNLKLQVKTKTEYDNVTNLKCFQTFQRVKMLCKSHKNVRHCSNDIQSV